MSIGHCVLSGWIVIYCWFDRICVHACTFRDLGFAHWFIIVEIWYFCFPLFLCFLVRIMKKERHTWNLTTKCNPSWDSVIFISNLTEPLVWLICRLIESIKIGFRTGQYSVLITSLYSLWISKLLELYSSRFFFKDLGSWSIITDPYFVFTSVMVVISKFALNLPRIMWLSIVKSSGKRGVQTCEEFLFKCFGNSPDSW